MEPVKVEAWKCLDGTIFLDYDRALRYNQVNLKKIKAKELFKEKEEEIIDYLMAEIQKPDFWSYNEITDRSEINLDFDPDGWDCECEDNTTGKCIYEWRISDESCIYCGEPEERK